ncbi:MAG: hypothetical protein ACLRWF_10080 [Ruthenibacterium sp.]
MCRDRHRVIAQLLGFYYDTDMPTTLRRVLPMLEARMRWAC